RAGNRMTDSTILTHHVLVLEHDAGPRAIVPGDIGAADQVDHLVCLDRTRARIHRVRTYAREIIDLEGRDGAVTLDANFSLAAVIARVNVGVKAFDSVGHEFDRPAQQL